MNRDKGALYPPFAGQLRQFEMELIKEGLAFSIFMGLRTWDEQDALYAQGRTVPGKIVTNAIGGDSWHCFGLAADYVLDAHPELPGIQWSWDVKADFNHDGRGDWFEMAELALKLGLEAGWFWKKFPDAPHVQNTYGLTLVEVKELYRGGGLAAVWQECSDAA
jgi:peptidoglycan L-alanyl-D-glutamate endopeptidase CwlK